MYIHVYICMLKNNTQEFYLQDISLDDMKNILWYYKMIDKKRDSGNYRRLKRD